MKISICLSTSKGLHEQCLEIEDETQKEDILKRIEDKTGIKITEEEWEVM